MRMPMKSKPKRKLKATAQRSLNAAASAEEYYEDEPNMRLSRAFLVVLILHIIAVGGIFLFNNLKDSHAPKGKPDALDKLPAIASTKTLDEVSSTPVRSPEKPNMVVRIHYLRKNETISEVAALYGVAVSDILEASSLPDENVASGTELRIPPRSSTAPVPLDVRRLVDQPRTPPAELVKAAEPQKPATQMPPATKKITAAKSDVPNEVRAIVGAPAHKTEETPAEGRTYTVAKGDNPVAIARKFGVSYDRLLKANKIDDPRKLQIGQKLIIPPKQ